MNLSEKIREVEQSIVAIGFNPDPQRITIIGSGFSVSEDGKILTVAHVYNQTPEEQRNELKANVMIEKLSSGLKKYKWIPIKLIEKNDKNDIAIFQLESYEGTLAKKLKLGDSDKVQVGDEAYFIGFPYAAPLINEGFGITLIANKGIISNIKQDGVAEGNPRNLIMVDAISNPGNSGSPLMDVTSGKVIGMMSIVFGTKSQTHKDLDIREPMHIAGARPINLAKELL